MAHFHWTGYPFIDAGLSALVAVTGKKDLAELTPEDLGRAVKELQFILMSDQAMGVGVRKNFATYRMGHLFYDGELHNPSNWRRGKTPEEKANNVREKFQQGIDEDLKRAKRCMAREEGDEICSACGRRCPSDAMVTVRKDRVPLLGSIVNFYSGFAYGIRLCGLCAFAVRFLPMSVMRSGNRLWFLHTQSLPIAASISRRYGWQHFHHLIASNEALDFFGTWETAEDDATVLYLLFNLLNELGDMLREIYLNPLPTTAYLFSSYGQSTFVRALFISNEVLRFLAKLHLKSLAAFQRFWKDLLWVKPELKGAERKDRERFVNEVAHQLLNLQNLLHLCLDDKTPKLRGGWVGHRLYLCEVMKMPETKLTLLERLGLKIARSEDSKKHLMELRRAEGGDLRGVLLGYVRKGWLEYDEFYALCPPNDFRATSAVRDILLAVIYEWQYCQRSEEPFPSIGEVSFSLSPDETLRRIRGIGERLIAELPNLKRWVGDLQTAKRVPHIRGVYLNAIRFGALRFPDFVFLVPLEDPSRVWLLRDYLLAFLFDRARDALPEEEEIATGAGETSSTENQFFRGGEG